MGGNVVTTSSSSDVPQQAVRQPGAAMPGSAYDLSVMPERRVTAWVGWIFFAATMLLLVGLFGIIFGLVAIFKDSVYEVPSRNLVVSIDYTAWGWVHLVIGVVAL